MSLLPEARNTWTPPSSAFTPSACPIITLRHHCTLLFTENTDKAFQCSFSKLNHSFLFSFLAQRSITDGPQDQSENHNIYQPSLVQGQPQNSDRQRCHRFNPCVGKIPWRRAWKPTLVFLPGEPMNRGAWQSTVHKVTMGQTRLKPLNMHAHSVG